MNLITSNGVSIPSAKWWLLNPGGWWTIRPLSCTFGNKPSISSWVGTLFLAALVRLDGLFAIFTHLCGYLGLWSWGSNVKRVLRLSYFSHWRWLLLFLWFHLWARLLSRCGHSPWEKSSWRLSPAIALTLLTCIGSTHGVDNLFEKRRLGAKVLLDHILGEAVLSDSILKVSSDLVYLSFSLESLDVQINLSFVLLRHLLLLPLCLNILLISDRLIKFATKTLNALRTRRDRLLGIVQCLRILLEKFEGVANIQTQLWNASNLPWLLLKGKLVYMLHVLHQEFETQMNIPWKIVASRYVVEGLVIENR